MGLGAYPAPQPPESSVQEDIDWIVPAPLPDDVDGLREVIRRLEGINRVLREKAGAAANWANAEPDCCASDERT